MNILVFSFFCAHELLYQSPGTGAALEAGRWIKKMSLAEAKQSPETLPVHQSLVPCEKHRQHLPLALYTCKWPPESLACAEGKTWCKVKVV